MKFLTISGILVASLALAGCSSMLNNKSYVPQANGVPVGNNLAMPPDLSLAQPRQTTDSYVPNGQVDPITESGLDQPAAAPMKKVAAVAPLPGTPKKPDLYEQYGVSKTNPDGTPKERLALQAELKAAMLKKKREKNPGYGTITNIGSIFNDQ